MEFVVHAALKVPAAEKQALWAARLRGMQDPKVVTTMCDLRRNLGGVEVPVYIFHIIDQA